MEIVDFMATEMVIETGDKKKKKSAAKMKIMTLFYARPEVSILLQQNADFRSSVKKCHYLRFSRRFLLLWPWQL